MKFKKAIVKIPGKSIENGLSSSDLGQPDYKKALEQHSQYIKALEKCGLSVTVMESDEKYPDSTFVEDTALLTPDCAVITNPGAESRTGETDAMEETINQYYTNIERITTPGTLDAGDVMMVGNHFYVGLSARTNYEGAKQLNRILNKYGMSTSSIPLSTMLHLKSGVSYLENNNLVVAGEFIGREDFNIFNKIIVDDKEIYAANCLWINDTVLIAKGYPDLKKNIELLGYQIIALDMSEFRKVDGGLSCLSLRF